MGYLKAQFGDVYTSYPHRLADYLINRFGISGKVLDLGCGRGEFSKAFEACGCKVMKMDGDKDVREYVKDADIVDIDGGLPYKDNTFDWIFCKHVIEHVRDAEKMTEEAYRVLSPKGKIIVITQNWFYTYRVFFDDYQHHRAFTGEALDVLLRAKGFKVNHLDNHWYQLPFTWRYPALKVVPLIVRKCCPWAKNKLIKYSKEVQLLAVAEK